MFSNFKDAFIRKPQFTVKTPDAVLEAISKGLPEGFRYVHDHDGLCRLECDGVLNITPKRYAFPEEAKASAARRAHRRARSQNGRQCP